MVGGQHCTPLIFMLSNQTNCPQWQPFYVLTSKFLITLLTLSLCNPPKDATKLSLLGEIGNSPICFCGPLLVPKGMVVLVVWYSYLY